MERKHYKQHSCWVDTGSARGVETLHSRRIVELKHYKQHSCGVDTGAVKEEILEKLEKTVTGIWDGHAVGEHSQGSQSGHTASKGAVTWIER